MKFENSSQPICTARLRGRLYQFPRDRAELEAKREVFLLDFRSAIWMTYRKNFSSPKIPVSYQCTSDTGWGCMVRSGQMLLSNCILRHMFPKEHFTLAMLETNKEARVKYLSLLWQYA